MEDVDRLIQAAEWAIRTTVPSNAIYSPAQMAFGTDMLFRQRIFVDWEEIKRQRTKQTKANNATENKKRITHE